MESQRRYSIILSYTRPTTSRYNHSKKHEEAASSPLWPIRDNAMYHHARNQISIWYARKRLQNGWSTEWGGCWEMESTLCGSPKIHGTDNTKVPWIWLRKTCQTTGLQWCQHDLGRFSRLPVTKWKSSCSGWKSEDASQTIKRSENQRASPRTWGGSNRIQAHGNTHQHLWVNLQNRTALVVR